MPSITELELPPPSPYQDITARRIIVASFWTVLLLGIPFWWNTTTIERLSLPGNEVQSWVQAGPCHLRPRVSLSVKDSTNMGLLDSAVGSLKEGLPRLGGAECIDFRIQEQGMGFDAYELELVRPGEIGINEGRSRKIGVDPSGSDFQTQVLSEASSLLGLGTPESDPRVVKFASSYKLVFSLLNQDSSTGDALLDWEIESLLQKHIQPLLSSLAPLHNFTIETQIQYFAPLSIRMQKQDEGTVVQEDELRAFVNPAEWNMASSLDLNPVLQFILYVPSPGNRPMNIHTSSGLPAPVNAFITPQWGGVVIFNPSSSSPVDLSSSFLLFSQQLEKLLGVPKLARAGKMGRLEEWQVDAMVRKRLGEATRESVDTLEAIVKLTESIPNMRVGKEVQKDVRAALAHLMAARNALASSTTEALRHSTRALELSSKAYFNPTMLALLYFPDEHKYAVYTPFFAPVMVPLLAALLKEWKDWKEKAKLRKASLQTRRRLD